MIGNISKYNGNSHNHLRKYKIVESIGKCLEQNKDNKKILKSAIYAIGNISFYTGSFAC